MKTFQLILVWSVPLAFFIGVVWLFFAMIRGFLLPRKDRQAGRESARQAREKILADGKVEGPKGPYVPHKSWNAGLGTGYRPPGNHGGKSGNMIYADGSTEWVNADKFWKRIHSER
jgi:prepilin-type processing-associated H-X9-DG protein